LLCCIKFYVFSALNRLLQAQSQPCSRLAAVLFEETELSPSFDCPGKN